MLENVVIICDRFDLGTSFRIKYGALLDGVEDLPVFRTTTSGKEHTRV